jgi:purine-binding chemotaxis protein CheW
MTNDSHAAARAPARDDIDVLRERAAALARVPRMARSTTLMPTVVFQLSDELYAIDARVVLQVIALRDLTPLPGARAPLFGVTHWRGDVLTILDLRDLLGVRQRGVTDLSRVVVVDGGRAPFGILADAARDFIDIDVSSLSGLPDEDRARRELVRGITHDAVLVLDTDGLLRRFGGQTPHDRRG